MSNWPNQAMLTLKSFVITSINKLLGKKLSRHIGEYLEIKFWSSMLKKTGNPAFTEELYSRLDPKFPFPERLRKYVNPESEKIKILDVGAGPISAVGIYWPEGPGIDLFPIDPLADQYDQILKEVGRAPAVKTALCNGEKITNKFPVDSFDLVYARNSLDHCSDPIKCFQEMYSVTKNNGYIYAEHARNEGIKENYRGFHQWNFDIINSDFCVWNEKSHLLLKEFLPKESQIFTEFDEKNDWIVLIIKKVM
ncbi:MAG: methyltransferase domain-containing protein [Candidatus Riflebacteria bacterium]|nr:methyltransferase domain-containing protein [Candidatus Riflebacteria bacterium]